MSEITFARLTFKNPDAVRKVISVTVDAASADDVVEWYKSHHAGDRVTVTKDSDIDLGIIYHVTDEQILSAWHRDRKPDRRPNPELEADDAPNALAGVGLTVEDIEAMAAEDD